MSKDLSVEIGYETLKLDDGTEVWNCISQEGRNYPVYGNYFLMRKDATKQNFTLLQDDVLVLGYMKCGTHRLWEIVNMLLKGKAEVDPVHSKQDGFFETSLNFRIMAHLPPPRILSSHLLPCDLPPSLLKCKNKILFPVRNPKDCAVSIYHHFAAEKNGVNLRCDWDTFINKVWFDKTRMIYATWVDYTLEMWNRFRTSENIMPVIYEHLNSCSAHRSKETVTDLANFLNLEVSEAFVKEICDATSFSNMAAIKRVSEAEHQTKFGSGCSMLRKVGNWRNHFSVNQSDEFDEKMESLYKEHPELESIFALVNH